MSGRFLLQHVDPEPAERLALRCRDGPGRRSGHARGPRSGEPVPGPARRPAPLVPLPPSVRGRAASPAARRAARRGPRTAPAGERLVRPKRRPAGGDRPRVGRRRLRASRRPHRDGRNARVPSSTGGHVPPLAGGASRGTVPRQARARHRASSPRTWSAATSKAWKHGSRTSNAAWRRRDDVAGPRTSPATAMVVIDHELFRRLPNQIAVYRAGIALLRGDAAGTITHARRALELAAEDDHLGRGSAAALLALAHWNQGDLDAAHRRYTEALPSLEKAGHLSDALGLSLALADILIVQGRLGEAMAHLPAGTEDCGRASAAGVAGRGGHARRHERTAPRAQRSRCRPAAPPDQHRARRTRRPPAERLPVAGRAGPDTPSPRRPGQRRGPARRSRTRLHGRLLARSAAGRGAEGTGPPRTGQDR